MDRGDAEAASARNCCRKPWYTEQSDKLAAAMQPGDTAAFKEFVAFHLPLATWGAKRWRWYFRDLEDEDRVQIATIGLIEATKRFDPSRGCQFSTYAYLWIRGVCQRHGAECAHFIRVPPHALQHCRKILARLSHFRQRGDDDGETEYLERITTHEYRVAEYWRRYCRIETVVSLSEPSEASYAEFHQIMAEHCDPVDLLDARDVAGVVRHAVEALPSDDAAIIRMRFGFDGEARTLQEIGDHFRLTRERIRQRILAGLERLTSILSQLLDLPAPSGRPDTGEDGEMSSAEITPLNAAAVSKTERVVLSEIAAHPSGVSCLDLSSRLGLPSGARRAAIRALVEQGRIIKNGVGSKTVYRIPQSDHCASDQSGGRARAGVRVGGDDARRGCP